MGIRLSFREDKAAEAAARVIQEVGGQASISMLSSLLYLSDREALHRWGRPITFDEYASSSDGPLPLNVLGIIHEPDSRPTMWRKLFDYAEDKDLLCLKGKVESWHLSKAEEDVLREISTQFGSRTESEVREHVSSLEEWQGKGESVKILDIEQILAAGGFSQADHRQIMEELEHEEYVSELLSSV